MAEYEATLVNLLKKYSPKINTAFNFMVKGNISDKCLSNAISKYANGVSNDQVLALYDTSLTSNGKMGYLFTDTKIYYLEILEKPKKIWYDDIQSVSIVKSGKEDYDNHLIIKLFDGEEIEWTSCYLNKTPLKNLLEEISRLVSSEPGDASVKIADSVSSYGAVAGGVATANYGEVNKLYEEEKFHGAQGHGFAAERANDLYDKLTGHDAKIIGDNNAKNGADRIVDGQLIQTKYYQTGKGCVDACFDKDGKFRYRAPDGSPMQIEVPSDKWESAVQEMEKKIREGKIEGVSDPTDAKKIVRKGNFTYVQAKNIAKAGTIESITYDAVNGTIIATSAFGITALVSFATAVWGGEKFDVAIKSAAFSGLKVGGIAFATTIIASQLSKAGLNSALVGSSEAIVTFMGPKASAVLINAFRSGSNIYGAAAMKSAAKLLRGNAITGVVTVVVLSSFDVVNIFRGRISGKQLFKNVAGTATTVVAGTGGWMAGAAIGTAIFPGVGTAVGIVGGLIGSVALGSAAGAATNKVLGEFIEDDAEEMVKIIQDVFTEMASEYLLSQKEAEKSVDRLGEKLTGATLKDMFASSNRKKFARDLLSPIIENETKKRKYISAPLNEDMARGLRLVLEELSDTGAFAEPVNA